MEHWPIIRHFLFNRASKATEYDGRGIEEEEVSNDLMLYKEKKK